MKDPMSSPGMQRIPRFPSKTYFIRDDNVARVEELDRDLSTEDVASGRFIWDEPYVMRPEPLQDLQLNVLAAIRDRFMCNAHLKPGTVH